MSKCRSPLYSLPTATTYWHYNKNALDAGALDAELRAILRKEVFPEHVEIEFERVMKVGGYFLLPSRWVGVGQGRSCGG